MRLIDADALIEDIKTKLWDWDTVDGITSSTVLKQTITDIDNAPTIDAVPVVRCKDCRWWDKTDNGFGYCMAMKHGYMSANWEIRIYRTYKGDFYCADGERKDDDKSCDTCKHYDKEWDDIICDGCTKADSRWERKDDE